MEQGWIPPATETEVLIIVSKADATEVVCQDLFRYWNNPKLFQEV